MTDPYVRLHGMAPALNYGQQAYEGLKAFRHAGTPGRVVLFRPDRNATRLQHSAAVISVPTVPAALFLAAVRAAVALNAAYVPPHATGAALYVRPQVYGSGAQLGLSPPDAYTFAVYVVPTGVYHGTGPVRALVLDEFDRAAPRGTGSAKVGGNYAPVLRWSEKALKDGFGITLHLDSATHEDVEEFSTSGFIGALVEGEGEAEKVTLVVPDSQNIIESVTSDSVLEIGRSFGWNVAHRKVRDFRHADLADLTASWSHDMGAVGLVTRVMLPHRALTSPPPPRRSPTRSFPGSRRSWRRAQRSRWCLSDLSRAGCRPEARRRPRTSLTGRPRPDRSACACSPGSRASSSARSRTTLPGAFPSRRRTGPMS